jgi:hypothetical protein
MIVEREHFALTINMNGINLVKQKNAENTKRMWKEKIIKNVINAASIHPFDNTI